MNNDKQQIIDWLNRCKENIIDLKTNNSYSIQEELNKVQQQYRLIHLLIDVLNHKSILLGLDINKFKR